MSNPKGEGATSPGASAEQRAEGFESNPNIAPHLVIIMGHSFIRRLQSFSEARPRSLNYENFKVQFWGRPSANLQNMYSMATAEAASLRNNCVILQIGGNDLNGEGVCPKQLANNICKLARDLTKDQGVRYVVISKLLYRKSSTKSRFTLREGYNRYVDEVNDQLQFLCDFFPKLRYWKHKRMSEKWEEYLSKDGTHLNPKGLSRYFRSIKTAVLHGVKACDF